LAIVGSQSRAHLAEFLALIIEEAIGWRVAESSDFNPTRRASIAGCDRRDPGNACSFA